MGQGGTHPSYPFEIVLGAVSEPGPIVCIGDEVATTTASVFTTLGVVTEIHGDTFTYGEQDIEVQPASVTLSTGDRWPVDQLVLLRRAGE